MIRKGISKQVISSVLAPTKIQKQAAFLNNIKLLAAKSEIAQRRTFSFSNTLLTEKKEEEDVVADTVEDASETEKLSREGIIEETEVISGEKETKEFQTETRQLLDIVATALYTDKEVFIRELISNASDALEKCRQLALTNPDMVEDQEKSLEISISVDEKNRTLTIQDSGIGMTKEELVRNIGTIAHSGSRAFMKQLREAGKSGDANNIIGQFGVGFYSVFMVTDKVRIYTRSCVPGSKGYAWESVGGSSYTLSEAEGVSRGTKIVLYLKETEKEFSMKDPVERIIKKYSNFVSFKISLNGARVNLLESIWLKSKDQVTPEQYKEFFKYISHYGGEPLYTLHFHTDVPLSIHGLFFVPKTHTEKLGMGKMDPGVNVYCKKVLIQAKHRDILPDWLRFVRGVVDSEDLPLNISREHLQDSPLIKRINGILTRKILKFFADMMKDDRKKYIEFHEEYNRFFKEGISSDFFHKDDLAKLLLFESNKTSETERVSLEEYINRMKPDQQHIYYLIAPNKAAAESSPYFEVFKKKDYEVLFLYNPIDEFVMTSIASFKNKELRSIERAELEENKEEHTAGLSKEQVDDLSNWFRTNFPAKVESVTATNRLSDTPVIIKNPENAAMRMMRKIQGLSTDVGPQKLEINPAHPLITRLYQAKQDQPELAKLVGEQLYDNAMISAGLMEDPRSMLPRLMELLKTATKDVQVPDEKQ